MIDASLKLIIYLAMQRLVLQKYLQFIYKALANDLTINKAIYNNM